MATQHLRACMQHEEGQALVLACLMVLVLSLAVLTTVNVGHTVSERVRLQNTADAAAYSSAALEARAFNLYAFTNRTQVSHYVSAMVWQSIDSFLYFVEAFLTDVYGVMRTLNPCVGGGAGAFWKVMCPALERAPYVGPLIRSIDSLMGVYRAVLGMFQQALANLNPDVVIGRGIIPAHRMLNGVLAAASRAVMEVTLGELLRTSDDVVAANDPNINRSAQLPMSALSACLFDRAHSEAANGRPFAPRNPFSPLDPSRLEEGDAEARAKRTMGQIVNATRFACDDDSQAGCRPAFVTSRTGEDLLTAPGWFGPLKGFMRGLPKLGQTRMLSFQHARGRPGGPVAEVRANNLRQWRQITGHPIGQLAQGDALGADDTYRIALGPPRLGLPGLGKPVKNPLACEPDDPPDRCWGDPRADPNDRLKPSVWAMSKEDLRSGGIHWRLVRPGNAPDPDDRAVGLNRTTVCLATCALSVSVYVANVTVDERDHNHDWQGLLPFSHFEPGQYEKACRQDVLDRHGGPSLSTAANRADAFNQPSTWAVLHKGPEELRNPLADPAATRNGPALLNEEGELKVNITPEGARLVLEDRLGVAGLAPGVTAIARGQVYYHRPGNWAEQPNFFNPYWRPRLASVYQGAHGLPFIQQLLRELPPQLAKQPQKVLTH